MSIEAVTDRQINRFLVYLKNNNGYSRKSVTNAWISLSSLWTWAEKELEIEHVIRGKIPCPKHPTPVVEPYTKEEVEALLKAAHYSKQYTSKNGRQVQKKRPTANRDVAIMLALLDSGARNQELCDLKIKDYNSETGRLFIAHGKNDKQRFVVLGNRARKALWRYLATRPKAKPNEPLFAAKSGEHLQRDNLRHLLEKIARVAGVTGENVHKFRHTFAINFLRNGGNILTLQQLLGHSSLEMVKRYARIAEHDIDKAVEFSIADNWKL